MNKHLFPALFALIYVFLYIYLSFIPRTAFAEMILVYAGLFVLYGWAWCRKFELTFPMLVILILAVRIPFFFHLPMLSDDFFRFLWDGLLLTEGLNPYGIAPASFDSSVLTNSEFAQELYSGMNSADFASVYPPLNQLFFAAGVFLSGNDLLQGVNVMRAIIALSEAGLLVYFLFRFPEKIGWMAAYLLNPLVVAEGIGNVHFEAAMVPFLAVAFAKFNSRHFAKAGMAWAGSILIKLTPLMLTPVFWFQNPGRGRWIFVIVSAFLIMALTLPWIFNTEIGDGLVLYFHHFEFNASIYYGVRWIGFQLRGYNMIALIGPALGMFACILIVLISWRRRRSPLEESALLVYLLFYLFSTTVHPWYGITVVFLAIFSNRPLLLIWSFTIWFSYSHYTGPIGPKWIWLTAEYLPLFIALILENRRRKWFQPTEGNGLFRG